MVSTLEGFHCSTITWKEEMGNEEMGETSLLSATIARPVMMIACSSIQPNRQTHYLCSNLALRWTKGKARAATRPI